MNPYETTATVENHGQVRVSVPFEAGTEVEVTVRPTRQGGDEGVAVPDRAARLFAALDRARNTTSIGPLRREELYDREVLR